MAQVGFLLVRDVRSLRVRGIYLLQTNPLSMYWTETAPETILYVTDLIDLFNSLSIYLPTYLVLTSLNLSVLIHKMRIPFG